MTPQHTFLNQNLLKANNDESDSMRSSAVDTDLPLLGVCIESGEEGAVALVYRPHLHSYQVWFQDLACMWHFAADSFTCYLRLAIMHAGVSHWRYVFTPLGLDPITAQWIQLLVPRRFAADEEWRVAKKMSTDIK